MAKDKEKHLAAYQGEDGENRNFPTGYGVTTVWGDSFPAYYNIDTPMTWML